MNVLHADIRIVCGKILKHTGDGVCPVTFKLYSRQLTAIEVLPDIEQFQNAIFVEGMAN